MVLDALLRIKHVQPMLALRPNVPSLLEIALNAPMWMPVWIEPVLIKQQQPTKMNVRHICLVADSSIINVSMLQHAQGMQEHH